MPVNGQTLLDLAPIENMIGTKERNHGVSWGLSEVGYDIRIKQEVMYTPPNFMQVKRFLIHSMNTSLYDEEMKKAFYGFTRVRDTITGEYIDTIGRTALGSSIEYYQLPPNLWGELRNKSTHARRFIDATIGTDAEPGWKGHLTIEMIFHGMEPITIPAGSGILKTVFHYNTDERLYNGKYQNQADKPVEAIYE